MVEKKLWPVCLPGIENEFFGDTTYVAGWGITYNSSKDDTIKIAVTPKLQKLTVPVLSLDECIRKYGLKFNNYIR